MSQDQDLSAVKDLIEQIASLPLEEHCTQFDLVHSQLQTALSSIDGL